MHKRPNQSLQQTPASKPAGAAELVVRQRRASASVEVLDHPRCPDYSRFAATVPLVEFLAAMPELRQTGPVAFQAADGQPWAGVMMAACSPAGNYASDGAFVPRVNVVELVCAYSGDPAWYDALAGRIARFLGWSAFADHEERQVWPLAE